MDKKTERSIQQKILRRVAKFLAPLGFRRTKPTYYVRSTVDVIEFIHFHKFSFDSDFRIHLGIRPWNDALDFVTLNGIDSDEYSMPDSPDGRQYLFRFHWREYAFNRSLEDIKAWCLNIAEPWFQEWRDTDALLNRSESPLYDEQKEDLRRGIAGNSSPERIALTCKLLNIETSD